MNHTVLLHPDDMRELHAFTDSRPARVEELHEPLHRSEAFWEDLCGPEPAEVPGHRRALAGLLLAAPLGLALMGVALAMLGHAG